MVSLYEHGIGDLPIQVQILDELYAFSLGANALGIPVFFTLTTGKWWDKLDSLAMEKQPVHKEESKFKPAVLYLKACFPR